MKKKRIMVINPLGQDTFDAPQKAYLEEAKSDNVEVEVVSLQRGPHHLEYHYYDALVGIDLLHTIKQAEKESYDAAVIACFNDPFLYEAREICHRLVITAPAQASLQLATVFGDRFSIIVGRNKWIPVMRQNVYKYGCADKLASFRSLGLGVLDFHNDESCTLNRLKTEARKAVEEDGAEVVILGCTAQFGFYKNLQQMLGAPVIDVMLAAFKQAEFFVDLRDHFGWMPSKIGGYETPPIKEIAGWGLEEQYGIQGLWTGEK